MSRRQIQTLYFGSLSRSNARLLQLRSAGLLRVLRPALLSHAGAIYAVTPAAAPLIAGCLDADPGSIRTQIRHQSHGYLEHTLAVVDLYLALREATGTDKRVRLDSWLPESLCRHEYEIRWDGISSWRQESFRPDACFCLAGAPGRRHFFLEMDLGHTSSRAFEEKIGRYTRYLASGLFERRYEDTTFTVLVATTGPGRLAHLQALASTTAAPGFLFSTHRQLQEHGALGAAWSDFAGKGARSLLEGVA